jgi:hypothetical protein
MNCECDTDSKGEVTAPCGAHMNWLRTVVNLNGWEQKATDLKETKKDLEYQKKRADTFEKLIVEHKCPPTF